MTVYMHLRAGSVSNSLTEVEIIAQLHVAYRKLHGNHPYGEFNQVLLQTILAKLACFILCMQAQTWRKGTASKSLQKMKRERLTMKEVSCFPLVPV
jgi:hypothetical protein